MQGQALELHDLLHIELCSDDLKTFDQPWEETLMAMETFGRFLPPSVTDVVFLGETNFGIIFHNELIPRNNRATKSERNWSMTSSTPNNRTSFLPPGERKLKNQFKLFQGPKPTTGKESAINGLRKASSPPLEIHVHSATTRRRGVDQRLETIGTQNRTR